MTRTPNGLPGLAEEVEGSQRWEALKDSVFNLLLPFWYAFGFMHCRNVSLDPRAVSPQAERRGTPVLDCRVLNIEPMWRVLRDEGNLAGVGPLKALHIYRGHFKDFKDGPGLFGKHKGVYWWEGSVRGSLTRGKVDKDYQVNPPAPT